jgi:hypothetical protein
VGEREERKAKGERVKGVERGVKVGRGREWRGG